MQKSSPLIALLIAAALTGIAAAQSPNAEVAYPERDILTPFRECSEIVAPPSKVLAQLQIMRAIGEAEGSAREFDADGREVVDDAQWQAARAELLGLGIDAGHLAQIIRGSRNVDERDLAFYGMFFCASKDDVFNLIGHIPGEPSEQLRVKAYPRAVAFLRAHINQRWGNLTKAEQEIVQRNMPKPGSPEAMTMGITRGPIAEDQLHEVNLRPFCQMLDRDEPINQAQALWFLKECFLLRLDLAARFCEPSLPRIQQLLISGAAAPRKEAEGLLRAIGGDQLPALAEDADTATRLQFVDRASRRLFPPIRQVSTGCVVIKRGPDRDAVLAAGKQALQDGSAGETSIGKDAAGALLRGFRITRVPDALAALHLPQGAILTAINGTPVSSAAQVIAAIAAQFVVAGPNQRVRNVSTGKLIVEYHLDGMQRAMEYRIE
jgi:hypothetical protein